LRKCEEEISKLEELVSSTAALTISNPPPQAAKNQVKHLEAM
jgi:hypothetical protein